MGSVSNRYFIRTLAWVLVSPWTYGYHIACLNQLQSVLTCAAYTGGIPPREPTQPKSLPSCIPMTAATFGLVTSIFTVGGLIGSLASNYAMHNYGRKGSLKINAAFALVGSAIMTVAWSPLSLTFGRFLIGIGAGMGLCITPVYLSEIAPQQIKGSIGVLNQVSIVIGLLITQAVGLLWATPFTQNWRLVFFLSGALNGLQLLASPAVADTPSWLTSVGRDTEAKTVASKLWQDSTVPSSPDVSRPNVSAEEQGLLSEVDAEPTEPVATSPANSPLNVMELFRLRALRKPVITVLLAMFSQQISGINAVIFYSNDILSRVVPPAAASYISLGIALLNAIMTFPAIFLIQHLGRRSLLLSSMAVVGVSLFCLAIGLNSGVVLLSSSAILIFVGSFAVGLGPVPYVLVGELVPFYASSSLASAAMSLGWVTNFIVGVGFLPLRNWLSTPDDKGGMSGEGNIFIVFAVLFAICAITLSRLYK